MIKKLLKFFLFFILIAVVSIGILYGSLAWSEGEPAAERKFFYGRNGEKTRPLVIAHRGGAGLFPENTLYAFEQSHKLGVDVLELDLRGSSDGTLFVMHDAAVNRTTDGNGQISEMTREAVKKLDAGYRFSSDGGKTFPFRGRGITVPTLREVFDALPDAAFNIELKPESPALVKSLCELIRERKMTEKVVFASFRQTTLDAFRIECGDVATSASTSEITKFLTLYKTGLGESFSPAMQAIQTPENVGGIQIVSKEFVEAARKLRLKVHVWTVNEPADMKRLLEAGVDGIMTDYPDRLLNLLDRTIIIEKKEKQPL